MTTIFPRASSSCTRNGRTSMMRASTWRSFVTMPDWLPVKLMASPPSSRMAIAEQRHRDALAGREQHVELTPVGLGRDLLGSSEQLIASCRPSPRPRRRRRDPAAWFA
jgi:hypothetical protein